MHNSSRTFYIFNQNNNCIESVYKIWDDSSWIDNSRRLSTYNGVNIKTLDLYQSWDGTFWVNSGKESFNYDGSNNMTEWIYQTWDGANWSNLFKNINTYDINNNLSEYLWQTWDGSMWLNGYIYSYTYVPVTDVEESSSYLNSYSLSYNFPNPFNPTTKITYSIPERGNVSLKVFDLLGSEVAELVKGEIEAGNYDITFNASILPSGIYFNRLQAGSFVQTRKMILLK